MEREIKRMEMGDNLTIMVVFWMMMKSTMNKVMADDAVSITRGGRLVKFDVWLALTISYGWNYPFTITYGWDHPCLVYDANLYTVTLTRLKHILANCLMVHKSQIF